jgi:REP-associated tyrosine transposase
MTGGWRRDGHRGVLQPKYWEHTIRDESDFERHADYIHFNPVKHGLVDRPRDWKWSSFWRYVWAGVYTVDWGCGPETVPDFRAIIDRIGE